MSHGVLWSFERKAVSERRLKYAGALRPAPVTAVTLSACGHFAVLGSAEGALFKCNVQSALYRGEFTDDGLERKAAHEAQVTAVAVTELNGVVASASLDGRVKVLSSYFKRFCVVFSFLPFYSFFSFLMNVFKNKNSFGTSKAGGF